MSNTNMTTASRRALLKGAASFAALAAPLAPAQASPASGAHPDAALVALGKEWKAAREVDEAAAALLAEGEENYYEREPAAPEAIFRREGDRELGMPEAFRRGDGQLWYCFGTVDGLRGCSPRRSTTRRVALDEGFPLDVEIIVGSVPVPEGRARAEEIVAAWDGWRAECQALKAALGLPEMKAKLKESSRHRAAIENRIALAPASTLDGLALKARVALWITGEDGPFDPADEADADAVTLFGTSIMRDLLALVPASERRA